MTPRALVTARLWILGAPDPEMEAIEALLLQCGERIAYAEHHGERVHPSTAYRADRPEIGDGCVHTVYCVECGGEWVGCLNTLSPEATDGDAVLTGCVVIDHHRPGDPGFGRAPSEFLAASSIGQVIAELAHHDLLPLSWERDREPGEPSTPGTFFPWCGHGRASETWVSMAHLAALVPHDLVLTAAADHCLAAAYRGECPGVDPEALMRWRAESRARFQVRAVEDVLLDIDRARDAPGGDEWR